MTFFEIPTLVQVILFPILVLGLWTLLFNSQNSFFTKIFVEGGFMLLGIPLIILTFLSIPVLMLMFWAPSVGLAREVTLLLGGIFLGLTLIFEYFFIKRTIKRIEEKEQMSIWQVIKREMDPETRRRRKEEKIKTKEEAVSYFDEISEMNRKRRELDREEKEKLRRALLGDIEE